MFKMHIFCPNNVILFPRFSDLYCILWGGKGRKLLSVQTLVAKYDPKDPIPHSHMNMYVAMSLMHTLNLFVFLLY